MLYLRIVKEDRHKLDELHFRNVPLPPDVLGVLRSHGCDHFQRSHNSLALKHVLSLSENDHTHKRALIDRKGMARGYLGL